MKHEKSVDGLRAQKGVTLRMKRCQWCKLRPDRGKESMRKFCQTADLFAIGGGTYGLIEVLWRGYTHWSMALLGGALFLLIGAGNRFLPAGTPLLVRGLAGAGVITAAEFAAGCILNLGLGLAVWDYSDMPFQLLGQICLPYSFLWVVLTMVASALHGFICREAWQGEALCCPVLCKKAVASHRRRV